MTTLKEIKTVSEATVGEFITELLDRLCNGLHVTASDGRDIREESNADEYDWADGEIGDLVEEYFGISQSDWSKYHIYKEVE